MAPPLLTVALCGPGDAAEGSDAWVAAEDAGRELATGGAVVVCGGLGGAMAAACRGAAAAGGVTVGLLPGDDRAAANEWVTIAIATGLGEGRNALVVRNADAVVAVGGGDGTLSEIAFALRAGLPVVGVGTWDLGLGGVVDRRLHRADGGIDAARLALAFAGARGR